MSETSRELIRHMPQLPPDGGALVVGFSGGLDSTVLLHALAQYPAARERGLRAVHVNHALHEDAQHWAAHCRAFADSLDVSLDIMQVQVTRKGGVGLEAAARDARLGAFADALRPGEVLVLAHHADDQAETVLLKLLRGAGPEGLGGMRQWRVLGKNHLWRPLLGLPRSELAEYARTHGLRWIDDPSNADTHLRRNFLRHHILPRLRERWPQASTALAHSAQWAQAAADFIDGHARTLLHELQGDDPESLPWRAWLDLPPAVRDPMLRLWFRELGLDAPAHFHVIELERQLRESGEDRTPCVSWDNTQVRRYRQRIYAMGTLAVVSSDWESAWNGTALTLPAGGTLVMQSQATSAAVTLCVPLLVRYRRGGERFKIAANSHHRELRSVLQDAGVPPWLRDRIPLVFAQGELIAIGDMFLGDAARALCDGYGARIVWMKSRESGMENRQS
ncbi:MAG TPA: tRNA lysidine(34) synthetase TilS [Rudaea sp.]|nr:tRNA lysidine(34) synthetase TilS [Rudaea sp.]